MSKKTKRKEKQAPGRQITSPRLTNMAGSALLLALLLVGSCEGGLLGISHSKGKTASFADSTDNGGQPPAYKAQAGQAGLLNSLTQSGFARGTTDSAFPGKPMLGKTGARQWAMPTAGKSGESGGTSILSSNLHHTMGARGPITGLSKRQMAWRKRRPTEQGKDRAASEINMAVGELGL
jgi:hypothetical protein